MAFIASSVSLHPSNSRLDKDPDGSYACITVKGNKEYEINQGTFMVKLYLTESPCQIIPLCQDNHEVIVHGRLVEFERGLVMTITANPAKVYPVPKRDFQHPSLLASAGTIARTSTSSVSGGVTWFDISCAGNLTSSPRSSRSQPTSGILRYSANSDDRKSGSTSRSGSTSSGSKKVTFDDILFPKHTKSGSDDSSRTVRKKATFFEESYEDDEISGTIRRVDTTNSDYFSSSAPATAYPPRATRSATSPLPPPPSVPLSRPRARTDNAPLSDIQADPRARDFSNQGNRSIDRSFVPRPLLGPVDSFRLSQSNKAGGRMEIRTLDKKPSTSALLNHRAPDPFMPSKITRAVHSSPNMKSKASFPSGAYDGTARRSEDLLWGNVENFRIDLRDGTEVYGRSIPTNDFISPTLQAVGSRYPTHRDRRRGIYGTPVSSISGASIIEDIAYCEQHNLVKIGPSTGETTLGSKQAQMKSLHMRRDAAIFGEKPEIEQPKMASTSSGPSLASTASFEPILRFKIRCFLPKGGHPFQNIDFSVGQRLAVIGELHGFVGEGPDRIPSIIVSKIGPYSLGTENAEKLNNCCGVSCTEKNPFTTRMPLAELDPVKVDDMRDLIRKSHGIDESFKSKGRDIKPKSPPDGAARRPALSKLRKVSSGRNIRSKVTQLFTRSSSKTDILMPRGSSEKPATTPRLADFSEGSSLTRAGLREAELRQELPRLRTAEAQALARQSFLPKLSRFSPLSMESSPPASIDGLLFEAGFSQMTMTPKSNELSSPVETRLPPLTMGPQLGRDLTCHPPAEKSARSLTVSRRRNFDIPQWITNQPFVFPQRNAATDVAVDPARSGASTPTTPTPATCTTSWETSSPIPHHHHQQQQQQPELSLPAFTKTWTVNEKKRAKQVVEALNSCPTLPPLKTSVSLPNLRFHPSSPSPPSPTQGIPKSHSAPKILPHRQQRVSNNVAAARSLASHVRMRVIKEEVADGQRTSMWYDSDDSYSDSEYGDDDEEEEEEEEEEEGGPTDSMLF